LNREYGKRYPNVNEHGRALKGTQTQGKTNPVRILVKNGQPTSRRGAMLLRQLRATQAEAANPNSLPQNRA